MSDEKETTEETTAPKEEEDPKKEEEEVAEHESTATFEPVVSKNLWSGGRGGKKVICVLIAH